MRCLLRAILAPLCAVAVTASAAYAQLPPLQPKPPTPKELNGKGNRQKDRRAFRRDTGLDREA